MKVAFLGLGIMGRPMATNLVKAGHQVTTWNRTAGKTVEGASTAKTPAEAAKSADVVWMCVSDTAAVEGLLFGKDGIEQSLRPGMIVVDSSTISPTSTLDFAERVRAKGAEYVDAPVTGSKIGAEAGQLIFIAGGDESTLARLKTLFSAMGKQVLHMGETGKGQSAKISANLMIAMIYEGFAEGLTLAQRLGVEPERLVGLVQASMIRSGVVDYKAPFVLKRDYSPNFPLRLMHKDIHLVLDAAQQLGLKLPGIGAVEHVYEESVRAGHSNDDYSATLAVLEKWGGLDGN
jgi:3-hydroxyisobutyrate dehydrogenase/2-hydroxy-3-oxopropionate reductase